jgi:hypothetical protein
MSGDNVTRFGQMFPYLKRTSSRAKNAKSTNTSLTSIDTVVEGISCYQWTLTLPPGWIAQLQGSETVIRFRIPENIRDLLAALVIELDNKDGSYLSTMSSSTLLKSMETIGI